MRLGYLYSRYPVLSQTFCDSEMLELERLGFELVVGSIYPPHTTMRHEQAKRLHVRVQYAPPQAVLRIWERDAKTRGAWPAGLVDLHEQKYGPRYKAAQRARNALYFADLFVREGVEHFHVHFANRAAHTALFVKALSGIPFSITAHGQDFMTDLGNDDLLREICEAAEFVAVETDYSLGLLAEKCPASAAKIHRVYNGIDLQDFPVATLPLIKDTPEIVSVGRLVPFKGFDQLIEACSALAQRSIRFKCGIVGEGPEQEKLQSRIDNLQLGASVQLLGALPREAVFQKMQESDIFALAATRDSAGGSDVFPTVILEAMAAARPVVSTAIAGISEAAISEETGLLVAPNDIAAFADALERLIRDPTLRMTFGQNGRARLEQQFEIRQTVRPLLGLLESMRSGNVPTAPHAAEKAGIHRIAYLIDTWPDEKFPELERELLEMQRRSVSIVPIICELNSFSRFSPNAQELARKMEFLPDPSVLEAEWNLNQQVARRLEGERAGEDQEIPSTLFVRQARFAVVLQKLLVEKEIAHVHATGSRALVTGLMLQKLLGIALSVAVEPNPAFSRQWIRSALKRCRGARISDRSLIRHASSSILVDKVAAAPRIIQTLQLLGEKIGIDLTGRAAFWQEWSELLVRWSRDGSAKIDNI